MRFLSEKKKENHLHIVCSNLLRTSIILLFTFLFQNFKSQVVCRSFANRHVRAIIAERETWGEEGMANYVKYESCIYCTFSEFARNKTVI